MKLHLYIFPSVGNGSLEGARAAAASVNTVPTQVTTGITASQLYLVGAHYASWFGFLYDNEVLDRALQKALPILLNHEYIDCFVLHKKVRDPDVEGGWRYFRAPRIFRSHVALKQEGLTPAAPSRWRHEHILDGWIEER